MLTLHCLPRRARALSLLVLAAGAVARTLPAQTTDRARVQAAVDSMAAAALGTGRLAGITIGVVQGRDTLVLRPYGKADLELDVPTPPRAIYEIGSITKQFTAAAILLLAEQGKLSLDDPLTKHLSTYPTQGHTVTIRRLLDHTSGIQGYTEMPAFGQLMSQRLPRDTLVRLFSTAPFTFAPGEALVYNNSGYFLLGLIIEKVSGQTYGDFVKQHLFDKAGMSDSRYCNEREIVKHRAHGYDYTPRGLTVKAHLDHTWPYAAGSLCSTVGDLIAWHHALHGGRMLKNTSYRAMTTPGTLNDGTRVRYAMGVMVDSLAGHRVIRHGGDINGFRSDAAWFPDAQLTIVALTNTLGPVAPGQIVQSIAELILGRPAEPAVALDHPVSDYVGRYSGVGRGDSMTITVTADGGTVRLGMGNGPAAAARYVGGETFMQGRNRFTFVRENGRVTALRVDVVVIATRLARVSGG